MVDTKSPELTLEGDIEKKICPNKEYEEEGYTSIDNYDGDITEGVISKIEKNRVLYLSIDSSGNKAKMERKLIREDTEEPKISLKGNSTMYVVVNNKFTDPV